MSQADRTVTPDLVERWSHDLARPDSAPMVGCRAYGFDRRGSRHRPQPGPGRPATRRTRYHHRRSTALAHRSRQGIDFARFPIPGLGRIQRGDSVDGGRLRAGHRFLRSHGVAARRWSPRPGATDTLQAKFGYVGLRLRRTTILRRVSLQRAGILQTGRRHKHSKPVLGRRTYRRFHGLIGLARHDYDAFIPRWGVLRD